MPVFFSQSEARDKERIEAIREMNRATLKATGETLSEVRGRREPHESAAPVQRPWTIARLSRGHSRSHSLCFVRLQDDIAAMRPNRYLDRRCATASAQP